jgi:hypothetical protein
MPRRPPYADIEARPGYYYDVKLLPVTLKNPYDMSQNDLMKCFVMAFEPGTFKFYSHKHVEANVCDLLVLLY